MSYTVFSVLFGVSTYEDRPPAKNYVRNTYMYYQEDNQWYVSSAMPVTKGVKYQAYTGQPALVWIPVMNTQIMPEDIKLKALLMGIAV